MINLLIADDEELERKAVKAILEKSFRDKFNIFEAKNGRQAIEIADIEKPEILIMDIKMPGINGIEAIQEIKKFLEESCFIVLTAYDYFNYAREAISCGVKDYLLKPLKRDELINKIQEAVDYIENKKHKRIREIELKERLKSIKPIVENELCYAFINNRITEAECRSYLNFLDVDFNAGYCIIVKIKDKYAYADLNEIERVELKSKIKDYVYDYISISRKCISSCLYTKDIVFFIEADENCNVSRVKNDSVDMARDIAARIKNRFNVSIIAGIGRVYNGIENFEKAYNEAVFALNYERLDMRVRHYGDIFGNDDIGIYYSVDLEKLFINSIYKGDAEESCKIFKDIIYKVCSGMDDMEKVRTIMIQIILTAILSLNKSGNIGIDIKTIVKNIKGGKFKNTDEAVNLGSRVILDIINRVSNKYTDTQKNVIDKAIGYINDNFKYDITLEGVADFVCVSPYYFSKIFKKFTGKSYIDYLTELRIERAKILLKDRGTSIKDVCFKVGYNDPNYFSRVFKKVAGLSPREFKDANGV